MKKKKIKVLVIDDSSVVRQTLTEILNSDPAIEVIATAHDPYVAVERLKKQAPDVITLDVEMPRMDGVKFLKKLMSQHPIPVVMCSSLTTEGCEITFQALRYGAVDIIEKPRIGVRQYLEEAKILICDAVKAASKANLKRVRLKEPYKKHSADVIIPKYLGKALSKTTNSVVLIGASTGGTEAIRALLAIMPPDAPGMVIVQHMPEQFTTTFAKSLNELCGMEVKEAQNGDSIVTGHVLIAPGNRHTLIRRNGARYVVEVKDGPLVNRHRPSVDVLFRSGARYAGANAVGVILTGMGDDGARGMLEMKAAGAKTLAQDEKSCVVFGMPKEAIRLGGVDRVLPLKDIPGAILRLGAKE